MKDRRRLDYHAYVLSKPAAGCSCLRCFCTGFAQSEDGEEAEDVVDSERRVEP